MKFNLIYLLPVLFFLGACGSPEPEAETEKKDEEVSIEENYEQGVPDPAHTAKNALDYYGAYEGIVVPCEDCDNVLMRINLFEDDTYRLRRTFLGESDEVHEDTGDFFWDDAGFKITFENIDPPNQFFVAEHRLMLLDEDGERVKNEEGDPYYLAKRR